MSHPKPEKLVQLISEDGIPWLIGKWVIYKKNRKGKKNKQNAGRFMIEETPGNWVAAKSAWDDCIGWQYIEDSK